MGTKHFLGIFIYLSVTLASPGIISASSSCFNSPEQELLVENWVYNVFGEHIGNAGIEVVPNSENYPEIILSFGEGRWGVVTNDFGPNGYSIKFSQRFDPEMYQYSLVKIIYEDMYRFGLDQILFIFEDRVLIYDRESRLLINEFELGYGIVDACIGDYDGDGDPEVFVAFGYDDIKIFDLESGAELHSLTYDVRNLIVGQFDDDTSLELVFSRAFDGGGYVIDLQSDEIEWVYYPDFGNVLVKGDVDHDDKDELIGMSGRDCIQAFDLDKHALKWEFDNFDSAAINVTDIEGDGNLEILLGGDERENIRCLNGSDGEELWNISNLTNRVTNITAADVDLDGTKEVIWGSGCSYCCGGHLYIADTDTKEIEWSNMDITPPFNGFDVADIDNNGHKEIVLSSFKSNVGFYGGIVMVIDAVTHRIENSFMNTDSEGVNYLFLEDLVPSSPGYECVIITDRMSVRSAITYFELWYTKNYISIAKSFDIDTDGAFEIIASGRESYGSYDDHIIVYDGATGAIEWESMRLDGLSRCLEIADIDNDDVFEIGTLSRRGRITIINGLSYEIDWQSPSSSCTGLVFFDIFPQRPGIEVLYSTDSTVTILDGVFFTPIESFTVEQAEIIGVQAGDIDKDGTVEILIADEEQLIVTDTLGDILWTSGDLGYSYNNKGRIICEDINDDGVNEVLIGGSDAFYEFRYGERQPDFEPPCEETGIVLELPQNTFTYGDIFYLNAAVCNKSAQILREHHIFVILDVFGQYWFGPSWIGSTEGIDSYDYTIPEGGWMFQIIPMFQWPVVQGSVSGVTFWGAITDPGISHIVGEMDQVQFGWQ